LFPSLKRWPPKRISSSIIFVHRCAFAGTAGAAGTTGAGSIGTAVSGVGAVGGSGGGAAGGSVCVATSATLDGPTRGFWMIEKNGKKNVATKNEGSQPESLKGKSNIAMEMSQMHSYRHPNTIFRRSLDLKKKYQKKTFSGGIWMSIGHEIPSQFMNGMPMILVSSQRD